MSESEQDRRETSADIADEIRRAVESMGDELPYTVSAGTMRRVADRIEAALRREKAEAEADALAVGGIVEAARHKPGNSKAMREALNKVGNAAAWIAENCNDQQTAKYMNDMISIVQTALSAPAPTTEKSSAVGNAAAIYAALVKIHDKVNSLDEECGVDPVEIRDIARAALSAPPRNCDRPECATSKAAQYVWRKEDGGKTPYYEWLLATAADQKGETK